MEQCLFLWLLLTSKFSDQELGHVEVHVRGQKVQK